MRISTRGRYSLEALLFLALQPENTYVSTRVISEQTEISDNYLEQLFIPLKKAGVICSARGVQGGYAICGSKKDISVGDILRAVESDLSPVACLTKKECSAKDDCKTRCLWSNMHSAIEVCVDSISLHSLVKKVQQSQGSEQV